MRTSQIVKPYALQEGDIVSIVAPAGNIKAEYLERGIAEIEKLGFKAKYRADILSKDRYTAGNDERRINELLEAFVSPEVKAIWCARGGYGTMRILRQLDKKVIYRHPKIFIGYSDITAFHLYLQACFNWVVFHGPMATKDLAGGGSTMTETLCSILLCDQNHSAKFTLHKQPCYIAVMREIKL